MFKIWDKTVYKHRIAVKILVHRYVSSSAENREKIALILKEAYDCHHRHVEQMFKRVKSLQFLQPDQLISTVQVLRKLEINRSEIMANPQLLKSPSRQIQSRYEILQEIGFNEITAHRLINFKPIYYGSIPYNRSFHLLPRHINIVESVIRVGKLPIADEIEEIQYNPHDSISTIHQIILAVYLKKRLQIYDYRQYNLHERSIQSIEQTIQLIEEHFGGDLERCVKGIIHYTPEELQRLIDLKYVCGVNMHRILSSSLVQINRFTMARCEWIERIFKRYKIPDYSMCSLRFIMLAGRDTVERHLKRISQLNGAKQFFKHPFITRLVEIMRKLEDHATANGLDFNHVFNDRFVHFYLNEYLNRRFAHYAPPYLSYRLNRSGEEIWARLRKHPTAASGKIQNIHDNLNYLLEAGYSTDDIFNNIYILLYPTDAVKTELDQLNNPNNRESLNLPEDLSKSKILQLGTLHIEQKFNFKVQDVVSNGSDVPYDFVETLELIEFIEGAKR